MDGTNKAHENGEAMGLVGVRLTAQLGHGFVCVDLAMHRLLGKLLGTLQCDAILLVEDELIVLGARCVENDLRACSIALQIDICRSRLIRWIEVDDVAKPTKETFAFDRGFIGLKVAVEAFLAD